jgi:hypothetical protein
VVDRISAKKIDELRPVCRVRRAVNTHKPPATSDKLQEILTAVRPTPKTVEGRTDSVVTVLPEIFKKARLCIS